MVLLRTAIDRTPGNISAIEKAFAAIRDEMNALDNDLNGYDSRFRMGANTNKYPLLVFSEPVLSAPMDQPNKIENSLPMVCKV